MQQVRSVDATSVGSDDRALVVDRPEVRVVDSAAMEWKEYPGTMAVSVEGGLLKVLSTDERGDPTVMLSWVPPEIVRDDLPHRLYHATAREFILVLGGELPHWERDPDLLLNLRTGFYMDRTPGTIHGLGVEQSPVGFTVLTWRTSGGTFVGDSKAALHTVVLPNGVQGRGRAVVPAGPVAEAESEETGIVLDWPGVVRFVDTRAVPWRPHQMLVGARQRILSCDESGDPIVSLTWLPPGPFPAPELPLRMQHEFHEFMFVLEGGLVERQYAGVDDEEGETVVLRAGSWVERRPGAVYGYDAGTTVSPVGCVFLSWRMFDPVFVSEQAFKDDTVHVPFPSG